MKAKLQGLGGFTCGHVMSLHGVVALLPPRWRPADRLEETGKDCGVLEFQIAKDSTISIIAELNVNLFRFLNFLVLTSNLKSCVYTEDGANLTSDLRSLLVE